MAERSPTHDPIDLSRVEIHQAAGMLAVQLDTNVDVALRRLIEHAARTDRDIISIAQDIISRQLTFSPASD